MATKKSTNGSGENAVVISPPKLRMATFVIVGSAPYVQNKFSNKAREEIRQAQEATGQGKSKSTKKREPKDFAQMCEDAKHYSDDGWIGIPAPAFRAAMVSACRIVGFTMTQAKLAVFVESDGFDRDDATPLVRIIQGEPEAHESHVRISQNTTTVVWRPMWAPGWIARPRITFDTGMFNDSDIYNLMLRVGAQVGVGEGRPDSKTSTGIGWGTFLIGQVSYNDVDYLLPQFEEGYLEGVLEKAGMGYVGDIDR